MSEAHQKTNLENFFDDMPRIDLLDRVIEKYRHQGWDVALVSPSTARARGAGDSILLGLAFVVSLTLNLIGLAIALYIIRFHFRQRTVTLLALPDYTVLVEGYRRNRIIHSEREAYPFRSFSRRGSVVLSVILSAISMCFWSPVYLAIFSYLIS